MAKAEGLAKYIREKLEDVVFYPLGDSVVVRQKGVISKRRYRKDKCFAELRKNQSEFGLAAKLSKLLRNSLHPYINEWKHPGSSAQLTGKFRKIIQQGQGEPGGRSFEIAHLEILDQQGLDPGKALLSSGKPFQTDRSKGQVYLRMTYGKLKKLFGKEAQMPVTIVLGVVSLSEVHFDKEYKVQHPEWHGRTAFNCKTVLERWPDKGELRLKVKLGEALPEGVGVIGVVGIE